MRKSKFTEAYIAFALGKAEQGTRVKEVCRKFGISPATFHNWKKQCGGIGVSELRRLKQLEEENRQPKQLVSDLSLDKQMLQDVIKNALTARRKRTLVEHLVGSYRVSVRRAWHAITFRR